MDLKSRFLGAMLGLAAGDALGTALEFRPPGTFEPITDMVGGGPFRLAPGQWTDDTSMALCLAASLVECGKFDLWDQCERYLRWLRDGYMSSTGTCFDVGNTVGTSLLRYAETLDPRAGPTAPDTAGNGSLMRLAPVPLFFARQPENAIFYAGESSRTTHGAQECIDACRHLAGLIVGALQQRSKEALLSSMFSPVEGLWEREPLAPKIVEIASGSYIRKEPPAIKGGGYVVHSLEAALWAFYKTDDFHLGALMAVNLGDDADTTGAVYGQIAGAYYGEDGIPDNWLSLLAHKEMIVDLSDQLFRLAYA